MQLTAEFTFGIFHFYFLDSTTRGTVPTRCNLRKIVIFDLCFSIPTPHMPQQCSLGAYLTKHVKDMYAEQAKGSITMYLFKFASFTGCLLFRTLQSFQSPTCTPITNYPRSKECVTFPRRFVFIRIATPIIFQIRIQLF